MNVSDIVTSPKAPPSVVIRDDSRISKSLDPSESLIRSFYLAFFEVALRSAPIVHPVQGLPTWPVFPQDSARRIVQQLNLGSLEDWLVYYPDSDRWKPALKSILLLTPGKVFYLMHRRVLLDPLRSDEINWAVKSISRMKTGDIGSRESLQSASSRFLHAARCIIHVLVFSCKTLGCSLKCVPICYTFEDISSPLLDPSKLPHLARRLGCSDDFEGVELFHTGLMQWMNTLRYTMVVSPGQSIFIRRVGAAVDMEVVRKFMNGVWKPPYAGPKDNQLVSAVLDESLRPPSPMKLEESAVEDSSTKDVTPTPTDVAPPRPALDFRNLRPVSLEAVFVTETGPDNDFLKTRIYENGVWRDATPAATAPLPQACDSKSSQLVQRTNKSQHSRSDSSPLSTTVLASRPSIYKSAQKANLKTSTESAPTLKYTPSSTRPQSIRAVKIEGKETELMMWPGELTIAKMADAFSKLPPKCPPASDKKKRSAFQTEFNVEFPGYKLNLRDYNGRRHDWSSTLTEDERWQALNEHGEEPFAAWWREWALEKAEVSLERNDAVQASYHEQRRRQAV